MAMHLIGCIYFFITSISSRQAHETIFTDSDASVAERAPPEMYVYFLHHASFLLTGKRMSSHSISELILQTFFGLFGSIAMAYIFAQIRMVFQRKNMLMNMNFMKP